MNGRLYIPLVVVIGLMSWACSGEPDASKDDSAEAAASRPLVVMTEEQFWTTIDMANTGADLDADRVYANIVEVLQSLKTQEVVAFDAWFSHMKGRAYREDVWDAMEVCMDGCGDDSFLDARAALVGLGQDAFEAVLDDPNELVKYFSRPGGTSYFRYESLSYASMGILTEVSFSERQKYAHGVPTANFNVITPAGYQRESALKPLIEWKARR